MESQFIFFCTNLGNEKQLKAELSAFYPELTPSYSTKGFLTYKNQGVRYDKTTIAQFQCTFAMRVGISLGRAKPDELVRKIEASCAQEGLTLDECLIHSFSLGTDYELDNKAIFGREVNQYSASGKYVIDVVTVSEKEVWYGIHHVDTGITRFPNAKVEIEDPKYTPSNGYYKLAEIVELFALKFKSFDSWLDFGSAPGGSSMYLLKKGCNVVGIDPASVDKKVEKHQNYRHISKPVQDLSQEMLPEEIHWVHSDLNLRPTQAIKEVLRLCKKYNHSMKGIIFTVQLPNLDYIKDLEDFEDQFYDWGFSDIRSVQVPRHKNEYAIIAQRF